MLAFTMPGMAQGTMTRTRRKPDAQEPGIQEESREQPEHCLQRHRDAGEIERPRERLPEPRGAQDLDIVHSPRNFPRSAEISSMFFRL